MNSFKKRYVLLLLISALVIILALTHQRLFIWWEQSRATPLQQRLNQQTLSLGNQVFIRIFKTEKILELWLKPSTSEQFILFRTYPICTFSGALGPKQAQGDRQSPEGFYAVNRGQLHPQSNYHRAFNLGFPNAYDRNMGYTGSHLMIHGGCASSGCYAMTDAQIDEIYTLVEAALTHGQPFLRVHIFPFKLTDQNLEAYQNHPWYTFWQMLKPGYEAFEQTHIPPNIEIINQRYTLCAQPPHCS